MKLAAEWRKEIPPVGNSYGSGELEAKQEEFIRRVQADIYRSIGSMPVDDHPARITQWQRMLLSTADRLDGLGMFGDKK